MVLNAGGPIPTELLSDSREFLRLNKRLSAFSRTLWFEARGWGTSEGDPRDAEVGKSSTLT